MNKEQAEALKLQVTERRNYFKDADAPLRYSKAQLHGGMQARVQRQSDRIYMGKIKAGMQMSEKNLKSIDKYIKDLNTYNNKPQQPVGEGTFGISSATSKIKAPTVPVIKMVEFPKLGRPIRRSIGGY